MGKKTETKATITKETITKATMTRLTTFEFAQLFNTAVRGDAKYGERSVGNVKIGETVPATRKAIADFTGLSYNALVAREKSYRAKGVNLLILSRGKRGAAINADAINAALAAEDAKPSA